MGYVRQIPSLPEEDEQANPYRYLRLEPRGCLFSFHIVGTPPPMRVSYDAVCLGAADKKRLYKDDSTLKRQDLLCTLS